jgi:hypothetical protein
MPADAMTRRGVDNGRVRHPSVVLMSVGKREFPLLPRRFVRRVRRRATLHLFVGMRSGLRLRLRSALALLLPDTVLLSHLSLQCDAVRPCAAESTVCREESKDEAAVNRTNVVPGIPYE